MTSEAPNRLADGAAGPASILHGRLAATVNILAAARAARRGCAGQLTSWGGASPRGTAPSDKALAGLAASRLMQGYARDEGCRFAVLLANTDGASPDLSDAFGRLREAEYRAEPEVEIPIEGGAVPPALLHADDVADAAVFLARSYAGAHPVHCDSDDATLDEVFRILPCARAMPAASCFAAWCARHRSGWSNSIGISSLGWRPDVPIRQRVLDLDAAWLRENVTAI